MTDTNLSYTNPGKMGDNDGPAVCVYAKPGYFRASLDIAVSDIRMQTLRADGRFVNAYIFLGVDILDAGGSWINCFDAGGWSVPAGTARGTCFTTFMRRPRGNRHGKSRA